MRTSNFPRCPHLFQSCKRFAEQFCNIQYGNLEFTGFFCFIKIINADRTRCYQNICSACYSFFNSLFADGYRIIALTEFYLMRRAFL